MAALRGRCLNEGIHQTQHILIVPEIYEGVVPIALLQVHKIKDAHIISLFS